MPVVVVATMNAKPESVDAVRDACTKAIEAVHQEPGCELYSLHEADGTFVFVEQWADADALKTHSTAPAVGDAVRHDRRAPRRCTRHQDAAARRRRRPGQGRAAALMSACAKKRSTDERCARSGTNGTLDGKVAFITGAARGQGRAEAVRLAADGADIIAIDICDQIASVPYPLATADDLAATVKLVEDTGARIVAQQADVRDQEALPTALQAGLDEFGRLDIVVANAGIAPMQSGADGWRDVIDVNLTGVYHTVEVAMPTMIEQGDGGVDRADQLRGRTDRRR